MVEELVNWFTVKQNKKYPMHSGISNVLGMGNVGNKMVVNGSLVLVFQLLLSGIATADHLIYTKLGTVEKTYH